MNLAACGAARQREDFVMRLGCFLVTFAVLASLVLLPPKAKAFAMTSSAVTALAGGFLSACGLTPVVSGMNNSGEVNESVARLIQDFLDAEHPGIKDAIAWIGDAVLTVNGQGRVIVPTAAAKKLAQFATWVAGKYGAKPGVNVVFSDSGITFSDGSTYNLSSFGSSVIFDSSGITESSDFYLGTAIQFGSSRTDYTEIVFTSGYSCQFYKDDSSLSPGSFYARRTRNGIQESKWINLSSWGMNSWVSCVGITFFVNPSTGDLTYVPENFYSESGTYTLFHNANYIFLPANLVKDLYLDQSLEIDVSDTMQEVLARLTALEEGQSIALDVGATQSMEIQEILQGILDAILAGDLAASAEIVDTAEVPVDPEEPDQPVVPVVPSGLDKLGAALTSRFPFSIPWDVYKGVTLLAAPPKAPYFEVDFMAPIADRVGGWKGSTKIVLDFSEYEIIGQVCRWTSTVGFCLMLASGTKRLIWTA